MSSSASVTINGQRYEVEGDSVSISSVNGRVTINGKVVADGLRGITEVKWEGPLASLTSDVSVVCGDVAGSVKAGTSVVAGNVQGDVKAGTSIVCGSIGGSAKAGTSLKQTFAKLFGR